MPRDLSAAMVRGLDRSRKLIVGQKVISLEIVLALIEPIVHQASCVIWTAKLEQLQCECALAFEVRPSRMDLRSGHRAVIDMPFNFKIGIWLDRTCGAQRSYSGGKI